MESRLRNFVCTRIVKMLTPHGDELQSDYIAELFNQPPVEPPDVSMLKAKLHRANKLIEMRNAPITRSRIPIFSIVSFIVIGMIIATTCIMHIKYTKFFEKNEKNGIS